mgnify:CR=1 FL=1
MQQSFMVILIAVGVLVFLILAMFAMFAKFYRKVEQGHALIINTLRSEPEVTFTGRIEGYEDRKVEQYVYRFPRVSADVVYLWPERERVNVVTRPAPWPWAWGW